MEGGDSSFHVTNLTSLTNEITRNWLTSIKQKPSILTTKLELIPISFIVGSYRPEIRDEFSAIYNDLFGESLKYTSMNDEMFEHNLITSRSRLDATEKSAPDFYSILMIYLRIFKCWLNQKVKWSLRH